MLLDSVSLSIIFKAILAMILKFKAEFPFFFKELSSLNTTSSVQCRLFSIAQWLLIALAINLGLATSEDM